MTRPIAVLMVVAGAVLFAVSLVLTVKNPVVTPGPDDLLIAATTGLFIIGGGLLAAGLIHLTNTRSGRNYR